jgi:fructose-bisphosphate aldolase class 1
MSMTDYIKKASEGDYEDYIEFLTPLVEDEIDNKKIPLREAAEAIISEAFYQLREQKPILDKLFLKANEVLDPPCQDDLELENHTFDEVVEGISRNELYMSQKTGTLPRQDRI